VPPPPSPLNPQLTAGYTESIAACWEVVHLMLNMHQLQQKPPGGVVTGNRKLTTESSNNVTTTLSRLNVSGYVRHATIVFSWTLTTVRCSVTGLGFGLGLGSDLVRFFIRIKQATKRDVPIKPGAYCLATYQWYSIQTKIKQKRKAKGERFNTKATIIQEYGKYSTMNEYRLDVC